MRLTLVAELYFLFNVTGDELMNVQVGTLEFTKANNGGVVSSRLFTITVDSTMPPGVYDMTPIPAPMASEVEVTMQGARGTWSKRRLRNIASRSTPSPNLQA
jgi:hypothetical protein